MGSASGLLYQNQSRLLSARYVLPAELASIEDYEERYLAMATFGLAAGGRHLRRDAELVRR